MHERDGAGEREAGTSYDYAKFPRAFVSYRWYKPLLVALLGVAFYFAFSVLLMVVSSAWAGDLNFIDSISEGYDGMDAYTGPGALFEFGSIAAVLPSLALAAIVVRDRPFSSYSSSRGGWNWGAFLKCLLVAIAVMAVDFAVEYALFPTSPADGVVRYTTAGLALCVVLVPLQCVAEEYLFRGFLLQAFSSWTKLPAVGIVVAAILFAAGHPYNIIGVIAVLCNGLVWGFIAWRTRGLEATSALHIVNNLLAFLAAGFGLGDTGSQVTIEMLVIALAIDVVYAVAVILLGERFGWFSAKGDGAAAFNAKKAAKAQRRLQQDAGQSTEPPMR